MDIVDLDHAELENLCDDWHRLGVSRSDIETCLGYCVTGFQCCAVNDNNVILAVFEKRDTLRAIKNMTVFFSPHISVDMDGENFEDLKKNLDTLVMVLSTIFNHFISDAMQEHGCIKIHSTQDSVRTVFIYFADFLQKQNPDNYIVKCYRNWIEINAK